MINLKDHSIFPLKNISREVNSTFIEKIIRKKPGSRMEGSALKTTCKTAKDSKRKIVSFPVRHI